MKQIIDFIQEKLKVNSDSKVTISNNDTLIYDGIISSHWKYDSAMGGRVDIKKLFPKIDKQYLKDHPCTQDELNYGMQNHNGDKSWEEWQQKCNRIAKIIETWPANIIARKPSMGGKKADIKSLPGFVANNDLEVTTNRNGKEVEIGIYDPTNHGITFIFKRK